MANNRQIERLDDLAFKALLRNNTITISSEAQLQVYLQYKLKHDIPPFLQSIADANPVEVKNFLDDCPELAVVAHGTVTGASGFTYQNVSAVELAYLTDDNELMNDVFLPAILKLPPEMIKKAETQMANKMAEIEKQRVQFKPYDFSEMVKAIANDQTLRDTGKPSEATQKALAKFKDDFKPGNIKEGKSWIKEHLQEAYRVYVENWNPWSGNQLRWYLINVIGHMQTLVEKCFEQECSQGLDEIVDQKKPNARRVKIKNWLNDIPLTYRGAADSSLLLGRDFFVEIIYGSGSRVCAVFCFRSPHLKNYVEQKNQQWKTLCSSLANNFVNNQHTNTY